MILYLAWYSDCRGDDTMTRSLPDMETVYNALLNKDSGFEGVFVAGVKTTGIFCRPTCTARKPKREGAADKAAIQLVRIQPCQLPVSDM